MRGYDLLQRIKLPEFVLFYRQDRCGCLPLSQTGTSYYDRRAAIFGPKLVLSRVQSLKRGFLYKIFFLEFSFKCLFFNLNIKPKKSFILDF